MAGDPLLQFVRHCRESGALLVLCGNEATRAWLKEFSSELNLGGMEDKLWCDSRRLEGSP